MYGVFCGKIIGEVQRPVPQQNKVLLDNVKLPTDMVALKNCAKAVL